MRVLHVIADTDPRSPQRFAVDLSHALGGVGIESEVLALNVGSGTQRLDVTIAGTTDSRYVLSRAVRSAMARFDVTVSHGAAAGEVVAAAAGRKRPFVHRETVDTRLWSRRPERPRKAPDYLTRARAVVALSNGARADLIDSFGLAPSSVRAIPLGVRTERWHPPIAVERAMARVELGLPAHGVVALATGDLVVSTAIDVAIRSVIPTEGVHLLAVGVGPERVRLEQLADGLARGKVTFTGFLEDPRLAYAAADVAVFPATSGVSMPRSMIEAGLCGLPLVATPLGSVPEVVIDGHTGVIVPAGAVEPVTAALERLRNDTRHLEMLGDDAVDYCRATFDLDVVKQGWAGLLDAVA